MTDRLVICALLVAFAATAAAQSARYEPLEPLPLGSVLLTLPSPHVAAAGLYEVRFTHRFAEASGSGFHSLWGLDNGANVTMALSYVPVRDLEVSLARSNVLETFEAAAKYVVVQQAEAVPASLSVRAGVDYRAERDLEDRTSPFVQAIVSRRIGRGVELFALPSYALHAGRATAGDTSWALFDSAFNVPLGAALTVRNGLTAVVELIPANGDLPSGGDPAWAAGIKKAMGGHHFEILITNSAAGSVDQYVSSTYLGEPLESGGIRIGFNIERQFGHPRRRR